MHEDAANAAGAHPRSRGADTQRSLYFQGLSSCGAKITFTFEHGDTVQLC